MSCIWVCVFLYIFYIWYKIMLQHQTSDTTSWHNIKRDDAAGRFLYTSSIWVSRCIACRMHTDRPQSITQNQGLPSAYLMDKDNQWILLTFLWYLFFYNLKWIKPNWKRNKTFNVNDTTRYRTGWTPGKSCLLTNGTVNLVKTSNPDHHPTLPQQNNMVEYY